METGKVPENVLKRSVLKQIKTKTKEVINGAGPGKDCAIFLLPEGRKLASCMQEAPVIPKKNRDCPFGAGGFGLTMGQLIGRCVNNLAAAGARPAAVMITLLLPERAEEAGLRELMAEAEDECSRLSLEIAGGQTRVNGGVLTPMAVITGYGIPGDSEEDKRARPGQDIVISKWIGLEGTSLLAKRNREGLLARFPSWLVEEALSFDRYFSVMPEAAVAMEHGVCAMHDASEGGIFGALRELAEREGVGLDVDMKKLPLRQETVEVCEFCSVNPYELLSGGCLIMTARDGPALEAALKARQIPAVTVGKITGGRDRILRNGDEVRYLDRAGRDEIYRNMPLQAEAIWKGDQK